MQLPSRDALMNIANGAIKANGDRPNAIPRAIEAVIDYLVKLNDDPAADLPGTVRREPQQPYNGENLTTPRVVVKTNDTYNPWVCLNDTDKSLLYSNHEVKGWPKATPVEGTPAHAQQQKANSEPIAGTKVRVPKIQDQPIGEENIRGQAYPKHMAVGEGNVPVCAWCGAVIFRPTVHSPWIHVHSSKRMCEAPAYDGPEL